MNQHTRAAHTGSWERARTLVAAADFQARVLPSSNRHSIFRVPAGIYAVSKRPAGRRRVTGRHLRRSPAPGGWCGAVHTNTRLPRQGTGARRTIARLGWTARQNALVVRAEERPGVARPGFLAPRQLIVADPELLLHLCHGPGPSTRGSDARRRCRAASPCHQSARETGLCLSS